MPNSGPCSPSARLLRLLLACLLLNPWSVSAQSDEAVPVPPAITTEAPHPQDSGLAFTGARPMRVSVDLVLVPVTVTDPYNRLVTGLKKEDFVLYEGEQAQEVRYFSTEESPISLGVVLDLSKSMRDKIGDARQAVVAFFEAAHPQDDYFVVTFSDRPRVLADVTRSLGTIRAQLAEATPEGHTALLDAIYLGVSRMRKARYQRRALLVISDGGDNRSRYSKRELKRVVQEADVEIYAIALYGGALFSTPAEWSGKRLLTEITEATGGRTISLKDPEELPDIAAAISYELRNQYVLGYRSTDVRRDGAWRKIRVGLAQADVTQPRRVYWKKGYLAPSE